MTDRLISQQAAVDALARCAREKFNLSDEFNHYLAGLMDGEKAVRDLPEAVIRCKDCKYSYIHYHFGEDVFGSMRCRLLRSEFSVNSDLSVQENDYCSRAERREE